MKRVYLFPFPGIKKEKDTEYEREKKRERKGETNKPDFLSFFS